MYIERGVLISDCYDGYNKVDNIIRAYCNVHGLRKLKDAYKLLPKGEARNRSDENKAIKKYNAIFSLEHRIEKEAVSRHLRGEEKAKYIQKRREKDIKPAFEKFLAYLESIASKNRAKYAMNNGINYILNHREGLMEFIKDGHIPMSNNSCEQAIRPFVTIRNRCKFYFSARGAKAGAVIYSLMLTCKENRINPYMYLMYIFEKLPNIDLTDREELRKLLPYSETLPKYTKVLTKKEIKEIMNQEAGK